MKVAKFGGTSVASAQQIQKVFSIITSDSERKVVVVSAPGKRFKEDTKVTDLLIRCANRYMENKEASAELDAIVQRYREIAEGLELDFQIVDEIKEDLLKRMTSFDGNEGRYMDLMKASGEDNCAKVVARYFQSKGVHARYVNPREAGLLVSNEPGNGQVLSEAYEKLANLRNSDEIIIFPGFFGVSKEAEIVTLPRGGSDITGSILAAAVKADLYENFTDVDSVYAANPNVVNHPKEIKELTYKEMRELSYAGFSVFHDEALIPAFRAGIPVCIKNTNNPVAPGTMILFERNTDEPVVGIASDRGFCSVYLSKYLMHREIGFGRRLLQILEDECLSYEHTPSGIDDISVILREDQFDAEKESRVLDRIRRELEVDQVAVERNLAMVMIVGEGMKRNVGITAKATYALATAKVNIEMINQGSSEVSMMFGVKGEDADRAVAAIYQAFFA